MLPSTKMINSILLYPLGEIGPAPASMLPVTDHLHWLRFPLPFNLDHINLWLIDDEAADGTAGSCLVDCGICDDGAKTFWQSLFQNELRAYPLRRILVTHFHPDHVGHADWLCREHKVPLMMSAAEYAWARMMSAKLQGGDNASLMQHFQRHGLNHPESQTLLRSRDNYYTTFVPALPTAYIRLQDQQMLEIGKHTWQVIAGFGHSVEHISLYCAEQKILISGDMLLPRISTNISVFSLEPLANPLRLFLDSLTRLEELPEDTLILPSHGSPFIGLNVRIAQLRAHHEAHLVTTLLACAEPQSANELIPLLFKRKLDAHMLNFAMGEVIAHLHLLWYEGRLKRKVNDNGLIRFVRT